MKRWFTGPLFGTLGLAVSACGGGGEASLPTVVEQGWDNCIATDIAQDANGLYAGIKPAGAVLPQDKSSVSSQHSPLRESVIFRGSIQGVDFVCVYNTYAGVASLDWTP